MKQSSSLQYYATQGFSELRGAPAVSGRLARAARVVTGGDDRKPRQTRPSALAHVDLGGLGAGAPAGPKRPRAGLIQANRDRPEEKPSGLEIARSNAASVVATVTDGAIRFSWIAMNVGDPLHRRPGGVSAYCWRGRFERHR